ncbi:MAG: hypothetical protein LBF08_04040, partial [Dysgonamonadaceae bacterium]|nr:hypothetical protein [Dysgonamonadaceae bacterium]
MDKQIIDLNNPKFYTVAPDYSKDFLGIKGNKNYHPKDNKFGWNVFRAEIHIDKQSKILVEYRLLSKDNTEQCHARRVETENLTYWHFEFLDRQLNVSPDPFEPQLQTFLEYHYRE